jgi:hypothetical protein
VLSDQNLEAVPESGICMKFINKNGEEVEYESCQQPNKIFIDDHKKDKIIDLE